MEHAGMTMQSLEKLIMMLNQADVLLNLVMILLNCQLIDYSLELKLFLILLDMLLGKLMTLKHLLQ